MMLAQKLTANKVALALLFISILTRVGFALFMPDRMDWPDGKRYEVIAKSLLSGQGYGRGLDAPLHPLLITAVYAVFGPSVRVARIVLAVIGGATCWGVYALGRSLGGVTVGLLSLLVVTFYPLHIYISATAEYPQALFTFLLVLSLVLLVGSKGERLAISRIALVGLVMGLAALCVPTLLLFGMVTGAYLLFAIERSIGKRVLNAGVFASVFLGTILAWSTWHYQTTGQWCLISSQGGINFYQGNCELARRLREPQFEDIIPKEGYTDPYMQGLVDEHQRRVAYAHAISDLSDRDRFWYQQAWAEVNSDPKGAVVWIAGKAIEFFSPVPQAVAQGHVSRLRVLIAVATFVPLLVLSAATIAVPSLRLQRSAPLYLVIICQWAMYTAFFPSVRYRSPIDCMLIIIACGATVRLIRCVWPEKQNAAFPNESAVQ